MTELRFYWAKQLYEQIESICLSETLKSNQREAFKVYDNISKRCYNLLVKVKKMSTIEPLEKILKKEVNER